MSQYGHLSENVRRWSVEDVCWWVGTLEGGRFQRYAAGFETCSVDGFSLMLLTEDDLKEDMKVDNISHRKRLFNHVLHLKSQQQSKEKEQSLQRLQDIKNRLHSNVTSSGTLSSISTPSTP